MPGLREVERQALAIAPGCFQAGMHRPDSEISQPAKQSLTAFGILAEDFGGTTRIPAQRDIELLFGDVDTKPGSNNHSHVLGDIHKKSRAVPAVRQPCTQGP